MKTVVKINNLSKRFGDFTAVNNLSLSVPEGSIYGFLGPNGAGKTTTLRMIVGLTEPTSGEVEIFGEKVEFGSSKGREIIGFLPDVPGYYDWMTAKEFLVFVGELYSIPKKMITNKVNELLNLVNLYKQRNKKVSKFSRGMKQRLGIAQALMNDPKLLILDEPVSALDPIGRKEVMDIISSLAGKITVFFSTHILADVERICDRVIIINEGSKILEDSIANIKDIPDVREVEIELDNHDDASKFKVLEASKHIESVYINSTRIIIKTNDLNEARLLINELLVNEKLMTKKVLVKEVSLEDIFIKAVNNNA
jgi:ABC-2 type transport system ATP-binding protein